MAFEFPNTNALSINEWSFDSLSKKRIQVVAGVRVVSGSLKRHSLAVLDEHGNSSDVEFDKLVIATGGIPALPNIPGIHLDGVYTIKDMTDTSRIGMNLNRLHRFVVVGAGFSGLEAAERLLSLEKEVHMVIRSRLMRRQLEDEMSRELQSRLPSRLVLHEGASPKIVLGDATVTGIELSNDEVLETDAVLFMTGVRPSTEVAKSLNIAIGELGGIKVDENMETSIPGVYAVGDCTEMIDSLTGKSILMPIGSVAARAGRQAGVAAVGGKKVYDDTSLLFQYDRIFGIDIVCVGHSSSSAKTLGQGTQVTYLEDSAEFSKVALVTDNSGRLIGGQVIASRLGARIGYQILERIESGAILEERPLLEPQHKRMKELLEQTLGPIQ